jgi:pSer/pThr/pTyr-binding forkhead associated (FHA) protein
VSRLHALLSWSASGLWVADLGSRNGTHVNGQRLVGPARLRPGDRLVLGRTQAACLLAASEGSPAGPVAGPDRQRR